MFVTSNLTSAVEAIPRRIPPNFRFTGDVASAFINAVWCLVLVRPFYVDVGDAWIVVRSFAKEEGEFSSDKELNDLINCLLFLSFLLLAID